MQHNVAVLDRAVLAICVMTFCIVVVLGFAIYNTVVGSVRALPLFLIAIIDLVYIERFTDCHVSLRKLVRETLTK
jgi:fatty acid desaturase